MKRKLKVGDRVRLTVRTLDGWKGTGTVMEDQCGEIVRFRKDDAAPGTLDYEIGCEALRHEVAVLRSNEQVQPRAERSEAK